MSLLSNKLKASVGQEIVVVMVDNRAFRGTLVEFDDATIVLRSVVEGLPNNASGWEEPTVSTGVVTRVVTWQGTFAHEDTRADVVKLKDVSIQIAHVLRIWEYSIKNAERPSHTISDPTMHAGTRITKKL